MWWNVDQEPHPGSAHGKPPDGWSLSCIGRLVGPAYSNSPNCCRWRPQQNVLHEASEKKLLLSKAQFLNLPEFIAGYRTWVSASALCCSHQARRL